MVQPNKYYKSRAVGVTSKVGLTTDRDLAEHACLRNTTYFIPPRYRKSRATSHYTTTIFNDILLFDVTLKILFFIWYECPPSYFFQCPPRPQTLSLRWIVSLWNIELEVRWMFDFYNFVFCPKLSTKSIKNCHLLDNRSLNRLSCSAVHRSSFKIQIKKKNYP